MRVIQPLLLAALLSPASAEDYLPPSTGKFFYTDLKLGGAAKNSYVVEATVGSSRVKMNMKVSSSLHASTVYTDACNYPSPCNIPGLFNLGSSKSKTLIEGTEGKKEGIHFLEVDNGVVATITGTEYKDEHLLTYQKWGRMVTFLNQFLAVDNVDMDVKFDDHQGSIGLAPYSADLDDIEANFLWQLKNQGIIDHMVASFYLDDDESFIKFGSYDPLGLKPSGNLNIFKTVNVKDWTLSMPKLPVMNGVTSKHKVPNYLEINPAYPFIYVRS